MNKAMLAFDLGASSGRGVVGYFEDQQLKTIEIHRFENKPIRQNGHLCWNITHLMQELHSGIKKACQSYRIESVGIDTWGVDYGIIDEKGKLKAAPLHYRDIASDSAYHNAQALFSQEFLFQKTGNQVMPINSLFRLSQENMATGDQMLFMPNLLAYLLTGVAKTEVSIASTSQLLSWQTQQWQREILQKAKLPESMFPPIIEAGTFLGEIKKVGLPKLPVYQVLGHDTACAVASVPSDESDFLFLSCGTWALAGTELPVADISQAVFQAGFTNEGGGKQQTRLLKNLTGLWLIQELQQSFQKLNRHYNFEEMVSLSIEAQDTVIIDTQAATLQKPEAMLAKISYLMELQGIKNPSDGEVIRCVYQSLAASFAEAFKDIERLTQKKYEKIYVIGGGSQVDFLCQCLANNSGKKVCAGPVEATAYGNLAMQAIALGELSSLQEFRRQLQLNAQLRIYHPQEELMNELS